MFFTKEKILELVNKTQEYFDYMCKVDEELRVCNFGPGYEPEVHVYNTEDITKIAETMGVEVQKSERMLTVEINNVVFFTMK